MKVTVIAFGTRGDVQPLVILAGGIASRSRWCSEVVVVSHHQHGDLVKSLLGACVGGSTANFATFAPVDSPAVIWKGTTGLDDAEARANLRQENACVKACEGAGLIVFNMFALEGYHLAEKMQVPSVVCHPYLTVAPIPSSFAGRMRRAYPRLFRRLNHIPDTPINTTTGTSSSSPDTTLAESTSDPVPAAASLPNTGKQCSAAGTGDSCRDIESVRGRRGRGQTAWTHVEHWMWPLFTDRWGTFRERLGLHPCPLAEEIAVFAGQGAGGDLTGTHVPLVSSAVDPTHLPLILYLFSSLVVDTSPFWPESARVCGYVYPPTARMTPGRKNPEEARASKNGREARVRSNPNQTPYVASGMVGDGLLVGVEAKAPEIAPCLPPGVEAFLSARGDRPLYVGFGSMWGMCPPGYRLASALRVVLLGARQVGSRCLVVLPAREAGGLGEDISVGMKGAQDSRLGELDSATDFVLKEFAGSAGDDDMLVHTGPLAHDILLPRCSLAIHHGGSGTTAAVLRAGIPHVICPQQLDQLFWAERIRYLAVGSVMERSLFVGPESPSSMSRNTLVAKAASGILSALTPQVKLRAACFGVKVRAENGLDNAINSLSMFLYRHQRPSRPAPPYPPTGTTTASAPLDTAARRQTEIIPANGAREFGGSARVCAGVDLVREDRASYRATWDDPRCGGASGGEGGSGDRGDSPALSERDVQGKLILREMPNGLRVWCARQAEEETFFIYGEIFEDRTYARMGLRVRDGDTIWDVGANVGLASIFFELETDTPDSLKIYAFEPLPLNNTALKRNTSEHCPAAVVLGYALGAKNEDDAYATFYPRMPGNSTLKPGEKERLQGGMGRAAPEASTLGGGTNSPNPKGVFFEDAEQVACNVRTVSWAMASLRVDAIDLLKIDVEGAELDVLLGVEDQDWPRIRQVVAEVHPVGDRVARVCGLLRNHGFIVSTQALALDGTPLSPTHDAAGIARDIVGEDTLRPTPSESASTAPTTASFFPAERSSPMLSESVGAKATAGRTSNCCRKDAEHRARTGLDEPAIISSESEPARGNDGGDVAGMIAGAGDGDVGDAGGPGDSGQDEAVLIGMVFMVYATRS